MGADMSGLRGGGDQGRSLRLGVKPRRGGVAQKHLVREHAPRLAHPPGGRHLGGGAGGAAVRLRGGRGELEEGGTQNARRTVTRPSGSASIFSSMRSSRPAGMSAQEEAQ